MNFGFVPDSPDMFLKLKGIEYLNFIADIYIRSAFPELFVFLALPLIFLGLIFL